MQDPNELVYEWPPDIAHYEAQVLPGLTWLEAISAALAFLFPLAVLPGMGGLILGVLAATVALLSLKQFDGLGGSALPSYLLARFWRGRRTEVLELPLIMSGQGCVVHVENSAGETMMTLGEGDTWPLSS